MKKQRLGSAALVVRWAATLIVLAVTPYARAFPAFGSIAFGNCYECHQTVVDNRAQLLGFVGFVDPTERPGEPDGGLLPYFLAELGSEVRPTIRALDGSVDYAFQFKGTDRLEVTGGSQLKFDADTQWLRYGDLQSPYYYCRSDGEYDGFDWEADDPREVSFRIGVPADAVEGYYLLTLALVGRDAARDGWYQEFNFYLKLESPGRRMRLSSTGLERGQPARVTASGAVPGNLVYFASTFSGLGSTPVAPLNVILDLDRPSLLGSARADSQGDAWLNGVVPRRTPAALVYLQAAERGRVSNVLVEEIR